MDEILKDDRFSHVAKDPRFRRIPKSQKKIKIDNRFQSMFKEKNFKVKYTVDKRGRPANTTSSEDYKKFYHLSSSDELDSDAECPTEDGVLNNDEEQAVHSDREVIEEKIKNRLTDLSIDYARGEGVILSESSGSEEESSEESEDEELEHNWGDLDKDADQCDEPTHRIAVCNMDWDRIRAVDLMVLFNSFLPQNGSIRSVSIYPSEFGMKRMKEEEIHGPLELKSTSKEIIHQDDDDADNTEEGSKYHMEKLRQYQLNRLKYFYAIVVCDSASTANKLYSDCDGQEYESSATRLDLRFVPDDLAFQQEPKEECSELPDPSKYEPRFFVTTALQQGKVDVTWDETDPNRKKVAEKLFSGNIDAIDSADIKAYVASSASEDEDTETSFNDKHDDACKDPIAKYRSLISEIEKDEQKKKCGEVQMEVTWDVGVQAEVDELVKKKQQSHETENLTPFEKMVQKIHEKKKLKKAEKKKLKKTEDDDLLCDDDIPSDIDIGDDYFQEEFNDKMSKPKLKRNQKKKMDDIESNEDAKQEKAELELLLMSDNNEKRHFSLKSIQEQEKKEGKKKLKWKKNEIKNKSIEEDDTFKMNLSDERFDAIFTSHHFNIDPADANYRKTKGMEELRQAKLKRRIQESEEASKRQRTGESEAKSNEISYLVKTIKNKTQNCKKK